MSKDTILHHFLNIKNRPSHQVAIKYKKNGKWVNYSWAERFDFSEKIGCALLSHGVAKRDRVAILSNTRPEWTFIDMGVMGIGAVTVPIYYNSQSEDIIYILNNSKSKVLFCENRAVLKVWNEISAECPSVETVICIDDLTEDDDSVQSWTELLSQGEKFGKENPSTFEDTCKEIQLKDIATIIYTSGTTGRPKGVVLTHTQIVSEVNDTFNYLDCSAKDTTLSFLPYAHILGRVESWGNIYTGFTLGFAESIDKIRKNLREVRPTVIIAVPRIFEKIYNGVMTQAESNPLKHKLFNWAIKVGKTVSECKVEKRPIPATILAQYVLAKKLVFSKLKENLGGNIRFAISGGAPLSKEIAEFFHAADFLILEGYGLTETTAAVTLNTPFAYCFGTVGKPLKEVTVKIAEDGEILIKSDKVMKCYYRDEAATKAVMQDGFFATGDIGHISPSGFLKITDRKKDLIKSAGGKYIAPQKLENLIKLDKYVSNVLIHGDQKKYIVALITLDPESLRSFAQDKSIEYTDFSNLTQKEEVYQVIRDAVAETNSKLASYETIKNFKILDHDFTVETGELTPSLKVKRKHCDQKYVDLIDGMYGVDKSAL